MTRMLAALSLGYALGAIPFGLLAGRLFGLGDVRLKGSGNIGATNVLRIGGRWAAAATLLLDTGKGAAAVIAARIIWDDTAGLVAGGAAFVGHLYPVWLRFRGGKGVATMLGVVAAVMPMAGAVFALVWVGGSAATRMSSVGGLAGGASAPLTAATVAAGGPAVLFAAMATLVAFKHRANIIRLVQGTEPRIGR